MAELTRDTRMRSLTVGLVLLATSVTIVYVLPRNSRDATTMPISRIPGVQTNVQGDSGLGIVTTGTFAVRHGDEWVPVERIETAVRSNVSYVSVSSQFTGTSEVLQKETLVVSGTSWTDVTYDGQGAVVAQEGRQLKAILPSLVDAATGRLSDGDSRVLHLIDRRRMIVDLGDMNGLMAAGVVTSSPSVAWLGRPATEYWVSLDEYEYGMSKLHVWIDSSLGLKLKYDQYVDDDTIVDARYATTEIETSLPAGKHFFTNDYFGQVIDPAKPAEYYGAQSFDPTAGQPAPVSAGADLLYPRRQLPVDNSLEIRASAFITGTYDPRYVATTSNWAANWCVTELMTDSNRSVLTIQSAPDAQLPVKLQMLWPWSWRTTWDAILVNQTPLFEDNWVETGSSGTTFQLFAIDPLHQGEGQDPYVDYDFLVSWSESSDVQVALLARGVERGDLVSLVETFRAAAVP